jgi:hypothetical protein
MSENKEIKLIFEPDRGTVSLSSLRAVRGDRVGSLPTPTRRGCEFLGWYTKPSGDGSAVRVTAETTVDNSFGDETVLYAHWRLPERGAKKSSGTLKKQRIAVIVLAAVAVVLVAALIAVNYIVSIYQYPDADGTVYDIKRVDGAYALTKDGRVCETGRDGDTVYYVTEVGTQVIIDPETGEYTVYAVPDMVGTEEWNKNASSPRILMFKQLFYDATSKTDPSVILERIEVENEHGIIVLDRADQAGTFVIRGHESTALDETLFAQLSVGCGYTICTRRLASPLRLANGSVDMSEYGLAPETRTRTSEEGEEETYEYVPLRYTVTSAAGKSYTVTVGDLTPDGEGYYATMADRETVYVLPSVSLSIAFEPVESLVAPMIVYPIKDNSYYLIRDLEYFRLDATYDDVYKSILSELGGFDFTDVDISEEGIAAGLPEDAKNALSVAEDKLAAMSDAEFEKIYEKALYAHADRQAAFTYVPLDERENTLNVRVGYETLGDYMEGYKPNTTNIIEMLRLMSQMTISRVVKLSPNGDELAAHGLDVPAHILTYMPRAGTGGTSEGAGGGLPNEVGIHDLLDERNEVWFSEKTEAGTYYAYSPEYDMIVEIEESQLSFLGWEELDWYEREYFTIDIAYVPRIEIDGASMDAPIVIETDNSLSTVDEDSSTPSADKMIVYANGKKLNYTLSVINDVTGDPETRDALGNYRKLFTTMLTASMEGTCDMTAEEMAALRARPDDECQLKLTVHMDDGVGNTRYVIYRFYQITERKSYMTIEVLPSADTMPNAEAAQGKFYVSRAYCDKLIADAYRLINGEEIVPSSKN